MKLVLGDTEATVVSSDWVKYRDFAHCFEDCLSLLFSYVRRWRDSCRDFGMGKKKSDFFKRPVLNKNKNMIILFGRGGYLYSMIRSCPELTTADMAGGGMLILSGLWQNIILCFEYFMF